MPMPIEDPITPGRYLINEHQVLLRVHPPWLCEDWACCIHHPSAHPMVDWPLYWNKGLRRMERMCRHGKFHPDPDDHYPWREHDCDGCCTAD